MRYVSRAAIAVALSTLALDPIFALSVTSDLSIPPVYTSYVLVNSTRLTRTQFYNTYQAILVNGGPAIPAVTATVTSLVPSVQVAPGQGTVHFASVPANGQALSIDTFTILVDRSSPFFFSFLQWSFQNPVANPGPNQTVTAGSTVMLNGSASTNSSGIGSLTYSWILQSVPAGSMATLSNADMMIATFLADEIGTYTAQLTVSNGATSDSATVTVSTVDSPPVANAGANQTVSVGSTAVLNGSNSTDVDGQPLTYLWSLVSLPPTSSAALFGIRSVSPTFFVDVAGTYIVQLVVNDGILSSLPSTVTLSTENTPPVANAGSNQKVNAGALVQLNGSGSTDVDGNPLAYQWSLNLSQAPGSKATLSDPSVVNPTFTADVQGTYIAQLIVNDGKTVSQPSTVTITTNGVQPPAANAGPNQTVVHGTTVLLNGSSSSDPQGLPLTFLWFLITRPQNSSAALSATNVPNPMFTADQPGTYVAQLVVNNGILSSNPATVTITTTNTPPVANAGPNQNVLIGATVALDGSQSSDADNDPITFSWTLLSIPPSSNATLMGAKAKNPTFVADVAGTYVVQLIVNDPFTSSIPSTVTITVGAMTITLSPSPVTLYNSPGTLTVTLSPSAGAAPVPVTLSGFDPTVLSVVNGVTVPANSNGVNVTLTPVAPGTTQVIANAPGYQPGNVWVTVIEPSISVAITNNATAVGLTHTIGGTITLTSPAPQSGTTVMLTSDPAATGQVSFSPASVTIPAGSSTGTFTLTGVALGSTTITASSSGYTSATDSVLVVTLGGIAIAQGVTAAPGQSTPLTVQISTPAPVGGATIALSSSDTTILTVPASVFIPQGARTPTAEPLVTGVGIGSASVIASSGGFTGDSEIVNVFAAITFSPPAITETAGGIQNVNVNLSGPAPQGGLVVNLSSNRTNVANVPPSVTITAQSATVQVTAGVAGSATITASTTNQFFSPGMGLSVTVTAAPLTIATTSLPNGIVNGAYSQVLAAGGGTTPYTWSISAGSLPTGLTLTGSTISGTPSAAGTFNFTVKATDSTPPTAQTATQAFSIMVGSALNIATASLPNGIVNSSYSQALAASGGTGPYTWSIFAGSLPTGLTLTGNSISGTPSATGAFNFAVKATDSTTPTAQSATQAFSIMVGSALNITTASLPIGIVNNGYSQALAASGGTTPYTWSISAGSLPNGITLTGNSISGTPSATGAFNFTVKATDSTTPTAQSATQAFSIMVGSALNIATASLPSGIVNSGYSQAPAASGGTSPYTWSVSAGSLPNGITLTGNSISGTPSAAGTFNFTVTATDSTTPIAQSATQAFSITVGSASSQPI